MQDQSQLRKSQMLIAKQNAKWATSQPRKTKQSQKHPWKTTISEKGSTICPS